MKAISKILLLFAVFAFVPEGGAEVPSADRDQIVIGALLPLTGDLGFVGEDIRRGMELALQETENSAVRLKVIYEDTRNQAKDAVSGARKLLDVDRADILISLWDM